MIHEAYLKILEKHKGFKLVLIYLKDKNIVAEPIILSNCDRKGILVDFERTNTVGVYIPFYNDLNINILNLYNMNDIDLLDAKQAVNLYDKMKDKVYSKKLIPIIKQALNQNVNIVIKMDNKFTVVRGVFTNMGMTGLSLKVAPFFNREETLKYHMIYNFFDPENRDLLNIDEN